MRALLLSVGIGVVSGVLSGAFGIGGGIITTPGIRLLLGAPALVAVGTPLPVIFPSAVTGMIGYHREGLLEIRTGLWCGVIGSVFAVLGALSTQYVGGTVVMLATAALILYTAADMILQLVRPPRLGLEASEERDAFARAAADESASSPAASGGRTGPDAGGKIALWKLALIGMLTGSYSGFLGLGGGFVLVPMLSRWLGYGIKRAIGTSLLAIAVLTIPGTVTHALLGHIDWSLAAGLVVGVVPGAWMGSRLTLGSSDRGVRVAFAIMLVAVGAWLGAAELGWLHR